MKRAQSTSGSWSGLLKPPYNEIHNKSKIEHTLTILEQRWELKTLIHLSSLSLALGSLPARPWPLATIRVIRHLFHFHSLWLSYGVTWRNTLFTTHLGLIFPIFVVIPVVVECTIDYFFKGRLIFNSWLPLWLSAPAKSQAGDHQNMVEKFICHNWFDFASFMVKL